MKPSKPKKEFKNSKPNCKSGEVKEVDYNRDWIGGIETYTSYQIKPTLMSSDDGIEWVEYNPLMVFHKVNYTIIE